DQDGGHDNDAPQEDLLEYVVELHLVSTPRSRAVPSLSTIAFSGCSKLHQAPFKPRCQQIKLAARGPRGGRLERPDPTVLRPQPTAQGLAARPAEGFDQQTAARFQHRGRQIGRYSAQLGRASGVRFGYT